MNALSDVKPLFLAGELSNNVSEVLLLVGERGCTGLVDTIGPAVMTELVGVVAFVGVTGLAGVNGMLPKELRVDCLRLALLRLGDI